MKNNWGSAQVEQVTQVTSTYYTCRKRVGNELCYLFILCITRANRITRAQLLFIITKKLREKGKKLREKGKKLREKGKKLREKEMKHENEKDN